MDGPPGRDEEGGDRQHRLGIWRERYFVIPLTEERVWDDGKSDVSLLNSS